MNVQTGSHLQKRLRRFASFLILLLIVLSMVVGCTDPTAIGRFRAAPVTNIILDSLGVVDEQPEQFSTARDPEPRDLVVEEREYVMQAGDVLDITILDLFQAGVESTFRRQISQTGRIALPEVGVFRVAELTELEAIDSIENLLKPEIIKEPKVSVTVVASTAKVFSISGAVAAPNRYPLTEPDFRMLEALALAGGVGQVGVDYAYVVRSVGYSDVDFSELKTGEDTQGPAQDIIVDPRVNETSPSQDDTSTEPIKIPIPPDIVPDLPLDKEGQKETNQKQDEENGKESTALEKTDSDEIPTNQRDTEQPGDNEVTPVKPQDKDDRKTDGQDQKDDKVKDKESEQQDTDDEKDELLDSISPLMLLSEEDIPQTEPQNESYSGQSNIENDLDQPFTMQLVPSQVGRQGVSDEPLSLIPPMVENDTYSLMESKESFLSELGNLGQYQEVIRINLKALQNGDLSQNIVIRQGDFIRVQFNDTGVFYVMGQVARPGVYTISADRMTLKQAISVAGMTPLAAPNRCDITRRIAKNKEVTCRINLEKLFEGTQPDIFVKPNDMINVGSHPVARWVAVLRQSFRATYGFGFVYDRNLADKDFGN